MQREQRQEQTRPPSGAEPGPGDGAEDQDVGDLVERQRAAGRVDRPRPVEHHEVHARGHGEEQPLPAPGRGTGAAAGHPAGTSSTGSTDAPVALTAALTAAATVWETSGWKTLGTM